MIYYAWAILIFTSLQCVLCLLHAGSIWGGKKKVVDESCLISVATVLLILNNILFYYFALKSFKHNSQSHLFEIISFYDGVPTQLFLFALIVGGVRLTMSRLKDKTQFSLLVGECVLMWGSLSLYPLIWILVK